MAYQTFPGEAGSSRSSEKLIALRLPSLEGKTFLDVGCNEGFFCGYAVFNGAARAVGVDASKASIERARARFPNCEFHAQSWDNLDLGKFDCILLASALHYADDQEGLIKKLMGHLTPEGVLVLEIGIVSAGGSVWKEVKRAIDTRYFPSYQKVQDILSTYSWKVVGKSVQQTGDPIERYVIHIVAKKPYALLALSESASGKSSLAKQIFSERPIITITGDAVYRKIADEEIQVSTQLHQLCKNGYRSDLIGQLTVTLIEEGCFEELVKLWGKLAGKNDCYLDSFVPPDQHALVAAIFLENGYYPILLHPYGGYRPSSLGSAQEAGQAYLKYLQSSGRPRQTVRVTKLRHSAEGDLRWHLDQPGDGTFAGNDGRFSISGWAYLPGTHAESCMYVAGAAMTRSYPLDVVRRDVITYLEKHRLPVTDDARADAKVGFQFEIVQADYGPEATLGIEVGAKKIPLAKLAVRNS